MPIVENLNPDTKHYKGLHLYHHGMSSCSQRVRLCLEEKQVQWTSHIINMEKNEHLSAQYKRINPKCLVPAMIHNDKIVTESTDIIKYIDQTFPGTSLFPKDKKFYQECVSQSDPLQSTLKTLSFEYLFKPLKKRTAHRDLEKAREHSSDAHLIHFYEDFAKGFSKERLLQERKAFYESMKWLDQRLEHKRWLDGQNFSLSDIIWIANVHRGSMFGFPIHKFKNLDHWYKQFQNKPAYNNALKKWEPLLAKLYFKTSSSVRRLRGRDIWKHSALV